MDMFFELNVKEVCLKEYGILIKRFGCFV